MAEIEAMKEYWIMCIAGCFHKDDGQSFSETTCFKPRPVKLSNLDVNQEDCQALLEGYLSWSGIALLFHAISP